MPTSSLSHFLHGSAMGPVDQPSCGESPHCEEILPQKALKVLCTGAGVDAEQDGKGRAGNRKGLSAGSEWRESVFKIPRSPRQRDLSRGTWERLLPKSPGKEASERRHLDQEHRNAWVHGRVGQRAGVLNCNSLQRLPCIGCAPSLGWGGAAFPVSLCHLLWWGFF